MTNYSLLSTHMCYICTYLLNDCLFTVARLGMSIHISIFLSPSCLLFLVISFLIDISRHNYVFIMKTAVKSQTKKFQISFFIFEYMLLLIVQPVASDNKLKLL